MCGDEQESRIEMATEGQEHAQAAFTLHSHGKRQSVETATETATTIAMMMMCNAVVHHLFCGTFISRARLTCSSSIICSCCGGANRAITHYLFFPAPKTNNVLSELNDGGVGGGGGLGFWCRTRDSPMRGDTFGVLYGMAIVVTPLSGTFGA